MSADSVRQLDNQEGKNYVYKKAIVDLEAYDGRKLKGFVYHGSPAGDDVRPTKRYMGVILKVRIMQYKQWTQARNIWESFSMRRCMVVIRCQ